MLCEYHKGQIDELIDAHTEGRLGTYPASATTVGDELLHEIMIMAKEETGKCKECRNE